VYVDARETDDRFELCSTLLGKYDVERRFMEIGDEVCGKICIEWKENDFLDFTRLDKQVNRMIAEYGSENSFIICGKSFSTIMTMYVRRHKYPSRLYGFIGSLCDRGVTPLFVSNDRHGMLIMRSIFEKCNDDRVRTRIRISKPKTVKDGRIQALMGFGFSEGLAGKFLNKHKFIEVFQLAKKYGDGTISRYQLQKLGLSAFKTKLENVFKIMYGDNDE